jgi:hypothetical protein
LSGVELRLEPVDHDQEAVRTDDLELRTEPLVAGLRHDPHAALAQPLLDTTEVVLGDEVQLDRAFILPGIRWVRQEAEFSAPTRSSVKSPSRLPCTSRAPRAG